jgi:hypothetical protein
MSFLAIPRLPPLSACTQAARAAIADIIDKNCIAPAALLESFARDFATLVGIYFCITRLLLCHQELLLPNSKNHSSP